MAHFIVLPIYTRGFRDPKTLRNSERVCSTTKRQHRTRLRKKPIVWILLNNRRPTLRDEIHDLIDKETFAPGLDVVKLTAAYRTLSTLGSCPIAGKALTQGGRA